MTTTKLTCPNCRGDCYIWNGTKWVICPYCKGVGYILTYDGK